MTRKLDCNCNKHDCLDRKRGWKERGESLKRTGKAEHAAGLAPPHEALKDRNNKTKRLTKHAVTLGAGPQHLALRSLDSSFFFLFFFLTHIHEFLRHYHVFLVAEEEKTSDSILLHLRLISSKPPLPPRAVGLSPQTLFHALLRPGHPHAHAHAGLIRKGIRRRYLRIQHSRNRQTYADRLNRGLDL